MVAVDGWNVSENLKWKPRLYSVLCGAQISLSFSFSFSSGKVDTLSRRTALASQNSSCSGFPSITHYILFPALLLLLLKSSHLIYVSSTAIDTPPNLSSTFLLVRTIDPSNTPTRTTTRASNLTFTTDLLLDNFFFSPAHPASQVYQ